MSNTVQNGKGRRPERGRDLKKWSDGWEFMERAKKLEYKKRRKTNEH